MGSSGQGKATLNNYPLLTKSVSKNERDQLGSERNILSNVQQFRFSQAYEKQKFGEGKYAVFFVEWTGGESSGVERLYGARVLLPQELSSPNSLLGAHTRREPNDDLGILVIDLNVDKHNPCMKAFPFSALNLNECSEFFKYRLKKYCGSESCNFEDKRVKILRAIFCEPLTDTERRHWESWDVPTLGPAWEVGKCSCVFELPPISLG